MRLEYDLYTVQKIFIAMYCTLPAALPLPPSPIAVALASRPCAHIITLALSSSPSSWLAVHANCGCVRVGSLPPLQSSLSGVLTARVVASLITAVSLPCLKPLLKPHEEEGTSAKEADDIMLPPPPLPSGRQPWDHRELPATRVRTNTSQRMMAARMAVELYQRSPSTCAADDDYDGGTMTATEADIPPTQQRRLRHDDDDNKQRQLRPTVDDSGSCQGCCGAAAGYPMATLEHIVHYVLQKVANIAVPKAAPHLRHRSYRAILRLLFYLEAEPHGEARTVCPTRTYPPGVHDPILDMLPFFWAESGGVLGRRSGAPPLGDVMGFCHLAFLRSAEPSHSLSLSLFGKGVFVVADACYEWPWPTEKWRQEGESHSGGVQGRASSRGGYGMQVTHGARLATGAEAQCTGQGQRREGAGNARGKASDRNRHTVHGAKPAVGDARGKAGGGRVQATHGARPATGAEAQRTGQSRRREGTATRGAKAGDGSRHAAHRAKPAAGGCRRRTGQGRRREQKRSARGKAGGGRVQRHAGQRPAMGVEMQRTGQSRRREGADDAQGRVSNGSSGVQAAHRGKGRQRPMGQSRQRDGKGGARQTACSRMEGKARRRQRGGIRGRRQGGIGKKNESEIK
ncbi:hypothetical protein EDB83DRAFT_2551240 [Lactarius deliciosus]|nr:hypothetical protein EDB83DRAFT_2551240 [Lactarius deliciosus]